MTENRNEDRKAFALFVLLAVITPGLPVFALLALAQLPWITVIGGAVLAWFVGLAALCATYVSAQGGKE